MTKEEILKDIEQLVSDIDKCTHNYVGAQMNHDEDAINESRSEMSRLLVGAHQELTFLYEYIKEGGKDEQS